MGVRVPRPLPFTEKGLLMGKALVIVESPSKIKKIQGYLGPRYVVKASFGHCYQIDPKNLAIDIENNYKPKYVTALKKSSVIKEIVSAAKSCDVCYIASDPDREGEAIGWHLAEFAIKKNCDIKRVTFHEITKSAIQRAFKSPTTLNEDMYRSQQARAVLDRLVGYGVSPVLWRKVCKGTSAGRVQSIGLMIIVERQKEIDSFVPEEFWDIEGTFATERKESFKASYQKKEKITNEKDAKSITASIAAEDSWTISDVKETEKKRGAYPLFNTSSLQQFASSVYGWPGKKTMQVAQKLYEAGLITYMRTDSLNISKEALDSVRDHIKSNYGSKYLPSSPKFYKTKSKSAQEAHEGIRPTDLSISSAGSPEETKLYKGIYQRFVACQMTDALYDTVKLMITSKSGKHEFQANGQKQKFDGFLKVWSFGSSTDQLLPDVKAGEKANLLAVDPSQHFTKPPASYNDASLVKTLEENGVGRPSTYASIIDTLLTRKYVERKGKAFVPTDLGKTVSDFLKTGFPELMDTSYTARIEEKLDEIAEGQHIWHKIVDDFYLELDKRIKSSADLESQKKSEETDITCPKCGNHKLVIRNSRFGKFFGCSGFLEKGKAKCKGAFQIGENGEPIVKTVEYLKDSTGKQFKCDKCGKPVVIRASKRTGKTFGGCSGFPKCKRMFTTDDDPQPIEFKRYKK